jgi:hypothetical protein
VVIRFAISGGVAACFGATGQFAGPLGPLAIGIAAPLIVEKLARQAAPAVLNTLPEALGATESVRTTSEAPNVH